MATNTNKKQQMKRKMGDFNIDIRDSPFFKIRAVVSLLRPRFLQVLRTPDLQKCKAATEIEEGMKLVMQYYRQILTTEGNKRGEIEKLPRQFAPAAQNQGRQKVNHQAKQVTKETVDKQLTKETVDKKLSPPPTSSERTFESGGRLYGSYIVGGSLGGSNFITFINRTPPQYYGVTKETHHSNRCKPLVESTQET